MRKLQSPTSPTSAALFSLLCWSTAVLHSELWVRVQSFPYCLKLVKDQQGWSSRGRACSCWQKTEPPEIFLQLCWVSSPIAFIVPYAWASKISNIIPCQMLRKYTCTIRECDIYNRDWQRKITSWHNNIMATCLLLTPSAHSREDVLPAYTLGKVILHLCFDRKLSEPDNVHLAFDYITHWSLRKPQLPLPVTAWLSYMIHPLELFMTVHTRS